MIRRKLQQSSEAGLRDSSCQARHLMFDLGLLLVVCEVGDRGIVLGDVVCGEFAIEVV